MKKAKITLLAIAVVATVGTALAFKTNKYGGTRYCYIEATSQPSNPDCNKVKFNATARTFISSTQIYYTTTTDLNNCGALACPNVAELPFQD